MVADNVLILADKVFGLGIREGLPKSVRTLHRAVVLNMAADESATQQRIRAETGFDGMSLSQMVSGLRESGLIRTVPMPSDRRVQGVELTAKGRKAHEQLAELLGQARGQVEARLAVSGCPPRLFFSALSAVAAHAAVAGQN